MPRYYYNQRNNRFYRNILAARRWALTEANDDPEKLSKLLRAVDYTKLSSARWCREHPATVSRWLNLIPTWTRTMTEVHLHKWIYKIVHKVISIT